MCKRLSERAAGDLIAFARKALRAYETQGPAEAVGACSGARSVLAKHGLLTPADDPEVAAVFMDEGPVEEPKTYTEREGDRMVTRSFRTGRVIHCEPAERETEAPGLHCGWGDHGTAYHRPGLHGPHARFHYSETKEGNRWKRPR